MLDAFRRASSAPLFGSSDKNNHAPSGPKSPQLGAMRKKSASLVTNRVILKGMLRKKSSWNGKWQDRFFALDEEGRLIYYKKENEILSLEDANGCIPITTDTNISKCSDEEGRHAFQITVPASKHHSGRTFILSAATGEVASEWMEQIERVGRQVMYVTFPEKSRHW
mmetsp:Transcript_47932/g.127123  ORF Transcript_47932/g.127123 Transcript_47932/m.127123 type:complete len:167 (+) Transcript_47932:3-503(+)